MRSIAAAVILMLTAGSAAAASLAETGLGLSALRQVAPLSSASGITPSSAGEGKLDVDIRSRPLRQAVADLFRGTGERVTVAEDVKDIPITLNIRDIDRAPALRLMVKQAASVLRGLTVSRRDGEWFVHVSAEAAAAQPVDRPDADVEIRSVPGRDRKVSLTLRETPLPNAIQTLFRGTGLQFIVDPNVPRVPITLTMRDITFPQALRLIVKQAATEVPGLAVGLDGEIWHIFISHENNAPPATGADRKVTLDLREIPLKDAIQIVFRGTGLQYLVAPNVPNVPITMSIRDITIPQALRLIVKQAATSIPGLAASRDGEIWTVRIRPIAGPGTRTPDYEIPPQNEPPQEPEWEKTPLHFVRAQDVARWLGAGEVLQSRPAPAGPRPAAADPDPQPAPERPSNRSLGSAFAPRAGQPEEIRSGAPGSGGSLGSAFFPRPGGARDFQPEPPQPEPAAEVPPVPRGISNLFAVPADNSILAQGTPEALKQLRELLRMVDIPRRQLRLSISAGKLHAAGTTLGDAPLQLSDRTSTGGLELTATMLPDGENAIEVSVSGTVTLGGVAHPLKAQARVRPGQATELLSLGEGPRLVRIWVRAELMPDEAAITPASKKGR